MWEQDYLKFKGMKEPKTTQHPEDVLFRHVKTVHNLGSVVDAMQSYSDQQNAELRERVSKLETENKDYYLRVKELEFVGQVDSDCIESQSNEIDDLKAWKESAMKELNAIDLQSLGKKLGTGLGQSVSENVHAKVDGLLERVKELEGALTATLNVARAYDRSRFVDILDKAEKTLKK